MKIENIQSLLHFVTHKIPSFINADPGIKAINESS